MKGFDDKFDAHALGDHRSTRDIANASWVSATPAQRAVFLSFFKAEPLCIARCSVLSLLIRYRGSSFEAWTIYPLNVISEVIFFLILPRTRPASEFHST